MQKTLAIFSPNENAYSETFIKEHKRLSFNVKYYYNGFLPTQLEGNESLIKFSLKERITKKIKREFSMREYALLYSLKREKVDCVLTEYGPTACETLEVIKYLGLPMVVHFHGFDVSIKNILEQYKNKYQEVFDYANALIAVSCKMKADLLGMGCPEEKIFISTCGPNQLFLESKPLYKNPQFVSLGRFVEKKAPYLTILAFKKIISEYPLAKLRMIGDGELLPLCKNIVVALKLTESVDFLGIKSTNEIEEILEDSIAFVQHSIIAENGDSEGIPVGVLEAQAAALPVIATYHAGIPEVVIHNVTGLLSEEKDIDGMANNMLRVLNEKGLADMFGVAGRKRIQENFTLEKHLKTLEGIIIKAMNG